MRNSLRRAFNIVGVLALSGMAFFLGGILLNNSSLEENTMTVEANTKIIQELQAAQRSQACVAKANQEAFAQIVDRIGDNFRTPPAPDPDRLAAVNGLYELADFFRNPPPVVGC